MDVNNFVTGQLLARRRAVTVMLLCYFFNEMRIHWQKVKLTARKNSRVS
jgi:hypothetical protein